MRSCTYRKGFSIVELMIVVGVIGVLTAIAVPSYLTMRVAAHRNLCIANLKQIDAAIERWGVDNGIADGVNLSPSEEQICAYIYGGQLPVCPSGGVYTMTTMGQRPQVRCNVGGHELP